MVCAGDFRDHLRHYAKLGVKRSRTFEKERGKGADMCVCISGRYRVAVTLM